MTINEEATRVTEGPVIKAFFAYALPSIFAILCVTTSSVVDGLFLGRYVGPKALAAVSVLIPYFTLVFGLTVMLAVGGSVQASIYCGEKQWAKASQVFSKIMIGLIVLGITIGLISRYSQSLLLTALQADHQLRPMMAEYLRILSFALMLQIIGLGLYYFLRVAGRPKLGTYAMFIGALSNIGLNYLFVARYGWGISGAAWATVIAQAIQLVVLTYFMIRKQNLFQWNWKLQKWNEVWACAKNGFSEFINEISVGIVIYLINFLMMKRYGVDGVAAFSVVNYVIFINVMLCLGLIDGVPPMVGENAGAKRLDRVQAVMRVAFVCVLSLGILIAISVMLGGSSLAQAFLDVRSDRASQIVDEIIRVVWPIFLLNGLNILVALYLIGLRKSAHSSLIALSRSLVLPVSLVLLVYHYIPQTSFLIALPAAEILTLLLAGWFYLKSLNQDDEEGASA